MECSNFKKAGFIDRLKGIKGYCAYRGANITQYNKINFPPYIYCKGSSGEKFEDCAVQIKFKS